MSERKAFTEEDFRSLKRGDTVVDNAGNRWVVKRPVHLVTHASRLGVKECDEHCVLFEDFQGEIPLAVLSQMTAEIERLDGSLLAHLIDRFILKTGEWALSFAIAIPLAFALHYYLMPVQERSVQAAQVFDLDFFKSLTINDVIIDDGDHRFVVVEPLHEELQRLGGFGGDIINHKMVIWDEERERSETVDFFVFRLYTKRVERVKDAAGAKAKN